jgi:hypothetical protein
MAPGRIDAPTAALFIYADIAEDIRRLIVWIQEARRR